MWITGLDSAFTSPSAPDPSTGPSTGWQVSIRLDELLDRTQPCAAGHRPTAEHDASHRFLQADEPRSEEQETRGLGWRADGHGRIPDRSGPNDGEERRAFVNCHVWLRGGRERGHSGPESPQVYRTDGIRHLA